MLYKWLLWDFLCFDLDAVFQTKNVHFLIFFL